MRIEQHEKSRGKLRDSELFCGVREPQVALQEEMINAPWRSGNWSVELKIEGWWTSNGGGGRPSDRVNTVDE